MTDGKPIGKITDGKVIQLEWVKMETEGIPEPWRQWLIERFMEQIE